MGNSALCGDCCVDCFPWLLKKRRRFTIMVFGFEKCGKTPFIRKSIQMHGGSVQSQGNDSANFVVETLDVGEKTRIEFFDVAGDPDSRLLWPTYFNFGITGMIYVIDGSASDEVIEDNIRQLISLIQHDAIVKPRNSQGLEGQIHNPDGSVSKDLSVNNEEKKEHEGINGSSHSSKRSSRANSILGSLTGIGSGSSSSGGGIGAGGGGGGNDDDDDDAKIAKRRDAASREYYDTPVAIVIHKGEKLSAATREQSKAAAAGGSASNNRSGKFASQLCSKFMLQDRILAAVRSKIASTLLTPKKMSSPNGTPSMNASTTSNNHNHNQNYEEDDIEMSDSVKKGRKQKPVKLPPPFPVKNFNQSTNDDNTNIENSANSSKSAAGNTNNSNNTVKTSSRMGSDESVIPTSPTTLISSSSSSSQHHHHHHRHDDEKNQRNVDSHHRRASSSTSPIHRSSTPPPSASPSAAHQQNSRHSQDEATEPITSAKIKNNVSGSRDGSQTTGSVGNGNNGVNNNNSFELPSVEAIPFDAYVNCGGFRWQVFEVSSVNGENVVNTVDWIVNAMLRGRKA